MNAQTPKSGRLPERMCISCRKRFLKSELLRYALSAEFNPKEDPEQVMQGRGFYVCESAECRAKLQKRLMRAKGGFKA